MGWPRRPVCCNHVRMYIIIIWENHDAGSGRNLRVWVETNHLKVGSSFLCCSFLHKCKLKLGIYGLWWSMKCEFCLVFRKSLCIYLFCGRIFEKLRLRFDNLLILLFCFLILVENPENLLTSINELHAGKVKICMIFFFFFFCYRNFSF